MPSRRLTLPSAARSSRSSRSSTSTTSTTCTSAWRRAASPVASSSSVERLPPCSSLPPPRFALSPLLPGLCSGLSSKLEECSTAVPRHRAVRAGENLSESSSEKCSDPSRPSTRPHWVVDATASPGRAQRLRDDSAERATSSQSACPKGALERAAFLLDRRLAALRAPCLEIILARSARSASFCDPASFVRQGRVKGASVRALWLCVVCSFRRAPRRGASARSRAPL